MNKPNIWLHFFILQQASKRKRKSTERFGHTSENKDYHFLDSSSAHDFSGGSSDDPEFEPESIMSTSFKANEHIIAGLKNVLKQMCRIEAKIDEGFKSMQTIRNSMILSSIEAGCVAQVEKITELPIETSGALDHLESDLNTQSYRKKIVSLYLFRFYHQ